MTNPTKAFAKNSAMGLAALGMIVSGATPAMAQSRYYDRDRDGIGAGEIIAGAVVLGGLAAILTSNNDRDRYDDRYYGDRRYGDRYDDRYGNRYDDRNGYDWRRNGGSRQAVSQCVAAVERGRSRYGRIDVTEVRDIERRRDGYRVEGRVVAQDSYNGRWDRDDRYGRYGRDDRYGRYDDGKFTCTVRYGRVDQVRVTGLG